MRNRLEIMADIINAAQSKTCYKTHLMMICNLSHTQVDENLEYMIEQAGLMTANVNEEGKIVYTPTMKGAKLKEHFYAAKELGAPLLVVTARC